MPSSQSVPIKLPQLAMGGIVGSGLPIEPPAVAHSFRAPEGLAAPGSALGWRITNNFQINTPDRHHVITSDTEITPKNPVNTLDFILKPFNREDSYRLKVFVVAGKDKPSPIKISSSEPVRFISIPALVERPWYREPWVTSSISGLAALIGLLIGLLSSRTLISQRTP
jgi:hypothetical protein